MTIDRSNYVVDLVVSDLDAARAFYGGLLGCTEARQEGASFALFRFAGDMGLVLAEPGAIPELGDTVTRGVRVAFPVPDVDAARQVLAQRSEGPLPEVTEGVWGRWLPLRDPDGREVWLLQPAYQ